MNVAWEQLLWTAAPWASMAGWMAWSARATARVTAPTSKASRSRETMDCSSTTRQPAPPQPKPLPAPPPQVRSWMLVACPIHQPSQQKQKTKKYKMGTSRSLWANWKNRQMTAKPVGVWQIILLLLIRFRAHSFRLFCVCATRHNLLAPHDAGLWMLAQVRSVVVICDVLD